MKSEGLAMIAGFMTTVSFIPQILRMIKTRHTKDISLPMYIMYIIGISLWIIYGVINESPGITISNIITLALALIILTMKIRNG